MNCYKIVSGRSALALTQSLKKHISQLDLFLDAYDKGEFRRARDILEANSPGSFLHDVAGESKITTIKKIDEFLSSRLTSMVDEFSDVPNVKGAWYFAFSLADPKHFDYFKDAYNSMKRGERDGADRWKILLALSLEKLVPYKIDVVVRAHSRSEIMIDRNSLEPKSQVLDRICTFIVSCTKAKYKPNVFSVKEHQSQRNQSSARERASNIANTYSIRDDFCENLAGKKVLIFDDNKTTGTTLKEMARAISQRYPNVEIYILTLTKGRKPRPSLVEIDRKKQHELDSLRKYANEQLMQIFGQIEQLDLYDYTHYYLEDSVSFVKVLCEFFEVTNPHTVKKVRQYVDSIFLDYVWFETPVEEDPPAFNKLLQNVLKLNNRSG